MKKSILGALVTGAVISLLALTGCDTPVGDDIWLDEVANPFIGTWELAGDGMTDALKREFKADGTVIVTVPPAREGRDPTVSTEYYLIKDDILVHSQKYNRFPADPFKFRFTVIDNNTISLHLDGGGYQYWTRVGDENPNADRKIVLDNKLVTGKYWRRSIGHGTTEGAMFMYDWWIVNADGTIHVYHYMDKNKEYLDKGEGAYYFDDSQSTVRLIHLTSEYSIKSYEVSSIDWDVTTPHFAIKLAGTDDSTALKWERFNGADFWESGHTVWTE